eukprot:gene7151-14564_t
MKMKWFWIVFLSITIQADVHQNSILGTTNLLKALGKKHVLHHFRSGRELADAVEKQWDVISFGDKRAKHYFISCSSFYEKATDIPEVWTSHFESNIIFSSADDDLFCSISLLTNMDVSQFQNSHIFYKLLEPMPSILKLDQSVTYCLSELKSQNIEKSTTKCPIINEINPNEPFVLSITMHKAYECPITSPWSEQINNWNPNHFDDLFSIKSSVINKNNNNINNINKRRRLSEHIILDSDDKDPFSSDSTDEFEYSKNIWNDMFQSIKNTHKHSTNNNNNSNNNNNMQCNYDYMKYDCHSGYISFTFSSTSISMLKSDVHLQSCLGLLISIITSDENVLRIGFTKPLHTLNGFARGLVQSGVRKIEPYSDAGLDGSNVIVALADTGLDDRSCYFRDDINGLTPRSPYTSPTIHPEHRKIIQYVNYSSNADYEAGHGTHVSGTVAGHCLDETVHTDNSFGAIKPLASAYRGMAPGAKIVFFDMGANDDAHTLSIPNSLDTSIYPIAYDAGARIFSYSWGGSFWYDNYCLDTDRFAYEHPDALMVFAAGNEGYYGRHTVLSPGIAKNVLTVGATETGHTMNQMKDNVAFFSAVGPAPDG